MLILSLFLNGLLIEETGGYYTERMFFAPGLFSTPNISGKFGCDLVVIAQEIYALKCCESCSEEPVSGLLMFSEW